MPDQPPPKAPSGPPTDEDRYWLQHLREDRKREPERLEETAKFLVGIISISLTIFISNGPEKAAAETNDLLIVAMLLWMLSALLSFFVLFPWRYGFTEDSPDSIQATYRRITRVKRVLLVGSLVCFLVALGFGVVLRL